MDAYTRSPGIGLFERTGAAAHLEAWLTARNMRGDGVERLVVPVIEEERAPGDLIDLDQRAFREAPPIRA